MSPNQPEANAPPGECLDQLVQLFQQTHRDPLGDYAEALALLKCLNAKKDHRPSDLHQLFELRISDLLSPFAGRFGSLPSQDSDQYESAFREAVEWLRGYFDPLLDEQILLQEAKTLARQPVGNSSQRKMPASLRRWRLRASKAE